jgi:hypothetical protein
MLRRKSFLAVCLLGLSVSSCSNHAASNTSGEPAPASDSLGTATFSAVIDGTPVSGGAIDGLQQNNAAYAIPNPKGGEPKLLFWLFDTKHPDDQDFKYSMRIYLPEKIGTTNTAYVTANIVLSKDHFARYSTAKGTVTIAGITAKRVSGTFSAEKMMSSPDTPNVPHPQIAITDGKFDIPFATSKMFPM